MFIKFNFNSSNCNNGAEMVKSLNRFGLVETYFQEIADNSVPTTGEKVGKDTLGSKDPQVMFGTPTGLVPRKSSPMLMRMRCTSDGMGNKTKFYLNILNVLQNIVKWVIMVLIIRVTEDV